MKSYRHGRRENHDRPVAPNDKFDEEVLHLLRRLLRALLGPRDDGFNISVGRPELKGVVPMNEARFTCTTEEKVLITLTPETKKGAETPYEEKIDVELVSGDGSIGTKDDAGNDLPNGKFYAVSGEVVGPTLYMGTATREDGGTRQISVWLDVTGANADTIEATAEAPVLK